MTAGPTGDPPLAGKVALVAYTVLVAGFIAIAGPASAQDGARTTELVAVVARYDSAWNRRDTATVNRLLGPRYQYFSSRGEVSSRAETLQFLAAPEYVLEEARRSEVAVTLSGPVAVVSSRWQGRGTYQGERFVDDQRCALVWQQSAGRWRMLSEHCVQIAT